MLNLMLGALILSCKGDFHCVRCHQDDFNGSIVVHHHFSDDPYLNSTAILFDALFIYTLSLYSDWLKITSC